MPNHRNVYITLTTTISKTGKFQLTPLVQYNLFFEDDILLLSSFSTQTLLQLHCSLFDVTFHLKFSQLLLGSWLSIIGCMSSYGVTGPYFFEDQNGHATTVNSNRYVTMLETFVVQHLMRFLHSINRAWFQQVGSTSHTARILMAAVRQLFGERVISKNGDIQWPPRSPDLSACDFFFFCGVVLKATCILVDLLTME